MKNIEVRSISREIAKGVVEKKHYSRRLGIFWEAFGLFQGDVLSGVCVFGQPSAPIQKHAFFERDFRLYELTRLVVDRGVKNGASMLIGRALKLLKEKPAAVISYADSHHGHCGIVYQASNWIYTGAVVAHDSLYLIDGVPTHPMTIKDRFGVSDPSRWAKQNGIEKIKPKEKHRYFYFVGSANDVRRMKSKLAYPVVFGYPKVDKSVYDDASVSVVAASLGYEYSDLLI